MASEVEGPCAGCGPSLDWSEVKFRKPVEDWTGLTPESRLAEQIRVQLTGNVAGDE